MKFIDQGRTFEAFDFYCNVFLTKFCAKHFSASEIGFQFCFIQRRQPERIMGNSPAFLFQGVFYNVMKDISCHISVYKFTF